MTAARSTSHDLRQRVAHAAPLKQGGTVGVVRTTATATLRKRNLAARIRRTAPVCTRENRGRGLKLGNIEPGIAIRAFVYHGACECK